MKTSDENSARGGGAPATESSSTKVARVSFRDPAARRHFLRNLRRRMYDAGYSSADASRWIREHFGPRLPVTYVFGRDAAERCEDAALEVSGAWCKVEESR